MEKSPPVSAAYNFTRSGAGGYSIKPSNRFTYVDADGTLKDLYATVGDVARVELSGDLAVSRPVHYKRDQFYGCSQDERQQIQASAMIADIFVRRALEYLRKLESGTARYTLWFGQFDFVNMRVILGHLSLIDKYPVSAYTYTCICRDDTYPGYVGVCIYQSRYKLIIHKPLDQGAMFSR